MERETRSVTCNIPRCGCTCASPGEFAAHLHVDHGTMPSIAFVTARKFFGLEPKPLRQPIVFGARA